MKTKLILCFLFLGVLCGCAGPNQGTETQASNEPSETYIQGIQETLPTVQREQVGALYQYDPDRNLFIMANNHYDTITAGKSGIPCLNITILSKEKLDEKEIQLSIPVASSYKVSVKEEILEGIAVTQEGKAASECARTQFPYALYLCYQGTDFTQLAALEYDLLQKTQDANEFTEQWTTGALTNEEYEEKMQPFYAAAQTYEAYRDAELSGYLQLTSEDLPRFYVYTVTARFNIAQAESFSAVTITIGQQTYEQQIGKVTLRTELPFPAENDWKIGGGLAGILGFGNSPTPYNDGYCKISNYFSFTAERAMMLKELMLESPQHQLQRAWLQITSVDNMTSAFYWDMEEPIQLYEGDRVTIDIEYYDPAAMALDYTTRVWGYLIYDYADGTACKFSECMIEPGVNYYTLYALIFEGMDLESYYWDYYYLLNESWRLDY